MIHNTSKSRDRAIILYPLHKGTTESRIIAAKGEIVRPEFSIGESGWVTLCLDTEGNMFGINSMNGLAWKAHF